MIFCDGLAYRDSRFVVTCSQMGVKLFFGPGERTSQPTPKGMELEIHNGIPKFVAFYLRMSSSTSWVHLCHQSMSPAISVRCSTSCCLQADPTERSLKKSNYRSLTWWEENSKFESCSSLSMTDLSGTYKHILPHPKPVNRPECSSQDRIVIRLQN